MLDFNTCAIYMTEEVSGSLHGGTGYLIFVSLLYLHL